jgi:pyruvate/2-oxoglutarate dehydrogenase complex dihydrolipoamide acyltransferase (E2) component
MTNEIVDPYLAESTVEATVGSWHKKKGDQVSVG